jgi:hypothetical protein
VDQHENRDLTSAANFADNPNPGFVSRRAGRDIFDLSLPAGAAGASCCNGVIQQSYEVFAFSETAKMSLAPLRNAHYPKPLSRFCETFIFRFKPMTR